MKKKQIAWLIYNLIFVVPVLSYLTVNFYWWLFDGNILNVDKMLWSSFVLFCTGFISGMWGSLDDVW